LIFTGKSVQYKSPLQGGAKGNEEGDIKIMAKGSGFRVGVFLAIVLLFLQCGQNLLGDWQFYSTVAEGVGADLPNTFVTVNPQTGQMSQLGTQGGAPYQDHIDIDPVSGFLYGINSNDEGIITKININTGESSRVATIQQDSAPVYLTALAFSPSGILYGISDYTTFGVINLAMNSFTPVKDLDIPGSANCMAFSPQGVLYIVDDTGYEDTYKQWLRTINTSTGNITSTIRTGPYCAQDIDFAPDGYIYNTNYGWWLFKIDPANGKQTDAGGGSIGPFGGIASVPGNAKGTPFIYKWKSTDSGVSTDDGGIWQKYRQNRAGYLIFEPGENNTANTWYIDTWTAKDPNTSKVQKYYEQKSVESFEFLQIHVGKNTKWVVTRMAQGDSLLLTGTVNPVKIGTGKPSLAATLTGTEIWDYDEGDYRDIGSSQISMKLDVALTSYVSTHTGENAVAYFVDYLKSKSKYQQGTK
jgi:hypothetical protein